MVKITNLLVLSHPMWVRGLKLKQQFENLKKVYVAPYVGAWIETAKCVKKWGTL